MQKAEFEETLTRLKHQEPFAPFVIELVDGRAINVEGKCVVFNNGWATYFSPSFDMHMFGCDDVKEIRLAATEATT